VCGYGSFYLPRRFLGQPARREDRFSFMVNILLPSPGGLDVIF
jgi:hypothetical protein